MRLREVDASTAPDEELLELHALEEACAPPGEPFRPPQLSLARYRHSSADIQRHFFADEGGRLLGAGVLEVRGPSFAYVDLLVFPEHRRRGIGTALLAQLRAAASEAGASSVFGHHWSDDGAAFASHAGARDDQRDVRAILDLRRAALPEPVVPAGWRLFTWIAAAPHELIDSYARARNGMDDAPTPEGVVFPAETAEEVRETEALDERNEVAAFTDLRATPGEPAASTDDTAVAGWARGQGMGRAVKLESLRRLREDRPEVETVTTMNAELNAAMRHINTRLGFVPTATLTTAVLML